MTNPDKTFVEDIGNQINFRLTAAIVTCASLIITVATWGTTAKLSGAVIANGRVVIEGNAKSIQHPTGGVVANILVQNGTHIKSGDIVAKLDDTQARAALGIITAQLDELMVRRARYAAIRDGKSVLTFAEDITNSQNLKHILAGERNLFHSKRRTTQGRKAQLVERIGQLKEEVKGLRLQHNAKGEQAELVREELKRLQRMYKRKLVPVTRVLAMKRDKSKIDGEFGSLKTTIARTHGRIAEVQLQILAIDQEEQADAQTMLRDIEAQISGLEQKKIAAEDELKRVDILAPQDGIVHDLKIHTVGGVIAPGHEVMKIIPTNRRQILEFTVSPADIDQLYTGQPATVRLSAFNQRTTPEIAGTVAHIGADLTQPRNSRDAFYTVRISINRPEDVIQTGKKLVPGMPVEAFIETSQQTALAYLLRPLTDQFAKALREE